MLYRASKMAPRFFVEVLAKELGPRSITVNAILPTVTVGAGLSTDAARPKASDFIRTFNPMHRPGLSGASPTRRNTSSARRGHPSADLLHEREQVSYPPVFGDLAVLDTHHINRLEMN